MADQEKDRDIMGHPPTTSFNEGDMLLIQKLSDKKTYSIDSKYFGGQPSSNYKWVAGFTYAENAIVEYGGKFWRSLDDDNTGNIPADGSTFWEFTDTAPTGLVAGSSNVVYTDPDVYVTFLNRIWKLANETRPYFSGVFESGICFGDWEICGHASILGETTGAHGFAVGDVLTYQPGGWIKTTGSMIPMATVIIVVNPNQYIVNLVGQQYRNLADASDGALVNGATYYLQPDSTYAQAVTATPLFVAYRSFHDIDQALDVRRGLSVAAPGGGGGSALILETGVTPAAGIVTLDCEGADAKMFVIDSTSVDLEYQLDDDANAKVLNIVQPCSNLPRVLKFWATAKMSQEETRWNDATQEFTTDYIGEYEFGATWTGTEWRLKVDGPVV